MNSERRKYPRFEPQLVFDAQIIYVRLRDEKGHEYKGILRDISRNGLSIYLKNKENMLAENSLINDVILNFNNEKQIPIGGGKVISTWNGLDFLSGQVAISISLDNIINDQFITQKVLKGIPKHERFKLQSKLAEKDMDHLSSYRNSLVNCQMKLFIFTLTTSVTLASAYFVLSYYSHVLTRMNDSMLSFWRSLVVSLPGLVAISSAFMVAQKSISIQRLDAYLSILKDCYLSRRFPLFYRGWEDSYRKIRHVLNTKICNTCPHKEDKCANCKSKIRESRDVVSLMFFSPMPDLYHLIINFSFLIIILLSIIGVLQEFIRFQKGVVFYMFVTCLIISFLVITSLCLFFIFYHLRIGKYSFSCFRAKWCKILNRCNIKIYNT